MSTGKDRNYAWVVAMAAAAETFLLSAIAGTYGVFFVELMDVFQAPKTSLSVIGSLTTGLNITGILVGFLIKRLGHQYVGYLATMMLSLGYLISSFADELWILYLSLGVIAGSGYAAIRITAIVPIHKYFEKKKSLALSIITASFSIGLLIWPILAWWLIYQYTLRGAFLIIAGLHLHGFIFHKIMRDPDSPLLEGSRADVETGVDLNPQTKEIIDQNQESVGEIQENGVENGESDKRMDSDVDTHTSHEHIQSKHSRTKTLITDLGLSLYKDLWYGVWMAGFCICYPATHIMVAYAPPRAVWAGYTEQMAALLVTIFGFTGIFAKPVVGFVGDKLRRYRGYVFAMAQLLNGLGLIVTMVSNNYAFLAFMMVWNAVDMSFVKTLMYMIPVDLWGQDNAAVILGHMFCWSGVGALAGYTFIGYLLDSLDDHGHVFAVIGLVAIVGGGMQLGSTWFKRRRDQSH